MYLMVAVPMPRSRMARYPTMAEARERTPKASTPRWRTMYGDVTSGRTKNQTCDRKLYATFLKRGCPFCIGSALASGRIVERYYIHEQAQLSRLYAAAV